MVVVRIVEPGLTARFRVQGAYATASGKQAVVLPGARRVGSHRIAALVPDIFWNVACSRPETLSVLRVPVGSVVSVFIKLCAADRGIEWSRSKTTYGKTALSRNVARVAGIVTTRGAAVSRADEKPD